MTSANGSTKDLNDGRAEALHALLNSLSPELSNPQKGEGKLSAEQARKISDKLDEILSGGVENNGGPRRNEKGELVNEEGLPIIDINEPISAADTAVADTANQLGNFDDPDLLPLWTLSPAEKARRKVDRDRILDALEEEEHLEQTREAEAARARWHEEMEKRKEAAKAEMENLKKARELQKKMGRALLRSVVASRDEEEKERAEIEKADHETAVARKAFLKPKKSVSFADEHIEEKVRSSNKGEDINWGDVAPGRLRSRAENSLLTKGDMDRLPMKMHVVERPPRAIRSPEPLVQDGDSDDESVAGSLAAADSEDGELLHSDYLSGSEDEGHDSPSGSGSEDSKGHAAQDDEHDDWGGEDFDYARHQREIALEYYEKRKAIGAEVSGAMRAHTHDEDEWDRPEVPLEATLASPPPKPPISRFKAGRLSQPTGSTLASHSLGGSVLPSSHSTSLGRAVRIGKLQDGKLVGGERGESDDDVDAHDDNTKAILELLRKGEYTNIGPSSGDAVGVESHVGPFPGRSAEQPKASKVSKFKQSLSISETPPSSAMGSSVNSSVSTPIDTAARSSPKIPSSGSELPGMIVESPSSRPPAGTTRQLQRNSPVQLPPSQLPTFHSVILGSPSFPSPSSSSSTLTGPSPVTSTPLRPAIVERRPPTISPVRELHTSTTEDVRVSKAKVSRFKAERSK